MLLYLLQQRLRKQMLEGYHYQNAYITRDVDKWVAEIERSAKVERIDRYEGAIPLVTPPTSVAQTSKIAFIWIGNRQYELIQPIADTLGLYKTAMPEDDGLRFHHACLRVPDWADFRGRVDAQSYPVVIEGGSDALRFLYIDTRPLLGHYLEYVWMTDERWTQIGGR